VEPPLKYVSMGLYIFYTTVFFGFITGVLSVVVYVTPCAGDDRVGRALFSCNWFLTFTFTIFLFFLGAILLIVSFVLSDVCDEMLRLSRDPGVYGGLMGLSASASPVNFTLIIGNCMKVPPVPVFKSIGVGNFIDTSQFTSGFPTDSLNVDGDVDFSGVNEMINQANTDNVTSIGVPANLIEDALAALNALTAPDGNTYTAADCPTATASTCASDAENPSADPGDLANARNVLVTAKADVALAETNLTAMRNLASTLNSTTSLLSTQLGLFGNGITEQVRNLYLYAMLALKMRFIFFFFFCNRGMVLNHNIYT
jgi:hypothetical protein